MRKPLVEVAGVIDARVDQVADLLLAVRSGDVGVGNAWLFRDLAPTATLTEGPDRYRYRADGDGGTIEVDQAARTIAYQGGWWYRGEYVLEPAGSRTRIVHRVHNAATRARWAVPLANKMFVGFPARVRADFAETLRRIGGELGCRTHLELR